MGCVLYWRYTEISGSTPGWSVAALQPWARCSHRCASVTKQCSLVSVKNSEIVTAMTDYAIWDVSAVLSTNSMLASRHSMRQGLRNGMVSVSLAVCLENGTR